ncbi:hypothetical protein Fraau_2596 [Frateuria aurantia DSM 6220]|uniref:Uncharacterized protein n=2 Tax=Frateuria aurantia TaxID=81475 RepID=H8KYD7_FRAAD|nr:hypothetical protein Fraau_2596 [Frateuria aurantia DSM 6220]
MHFGPSAVMLRDPQYRGTDWKVILNQETELKAQIVTQILMQFSPNIELDHINLQGVSKAVKAKIAGAAKLADEIIQQSSQPAE